MKFFHSLIWDKRNPGLGQRYRRQHEMIMVAHVAGGRIRWNADNRLVPNVLSMMPPRDRDHPNEKPLKLLEKLIETHGNFADSILDPFMGSGTTGVACVNMGRAFTGIEIDAGYFDTACRRIEDAVSRPRLALNELPKPVQEVFEL